MKAVTLAGGLGARLSEETVLRPKPMIEIVGRPILWHGMTIFSSRGVTDFIICLGDKGYMTNEFFLNHRLRLSDVAMHLGRGDIEYHRRAGEDWKVSLIETGEATMAGGRLERIQPDLDGNDDFFMTYGDGVSDLDALLRFHREQKRLCTLTAVLPPGRFGALELDGGRVRSFRAKPAGDGARINGGFFVLQPSALDLIAGDETTREAGPMEQLARDNQLSAYSHDGLRQVTDSLRDEDHLEKPGERPSALEHAVRAAAKHEPEAAFWAERRVLVTRHTGLEGYRLALWLERLGALVASLTLAPDHRPTPFGLVIPRRQEKPVDLRNAAAAARVAVARPEMALRLAAQAVVRPSDAGPVAIDATKMLGTAHLLEAVRAASCVPLIMVLTSDKAYENRKRPWPYREGDAVGDGDWSPDRPVPDLVRVFSCGKAAVIRFPDAIRPWQHALEPPCGYLMLAERLGSADGAAFAQSWTFGPRDCRPVHEAVERVVRHWGARPLGRPSRRRSRTRRRFSRWTPPKPALGSAGRAASASTRRCAGRWTGTAASSADRRHGPPWQGRSRPMETWPASAIGLARAVSSGLR